MRFSNLHLISPFSGLAAPMKILNVGAAVLSGDLDASHTAIAARRSAHLLLRAPSSLAGLHEKPLYFVEDVLAFPLRYPAFRK